MEIVIKNTGKGHDIKTSKDSLYLGNDEERKIDNASQEDLDRLKDDRDLLIDVGKHRVTG